MAETGQAAPAGQQAGAVAPLSRARRFFWPVVLIGVVGAGLAAFAGGHEWLNVAIPKGSVSTETATKPDSPATTALALVALAAWGVLLVTRKRIRRGVAILAVIAGLGALATTFQRPSATNQAWASYVPAGSTPHDTVWPWIALVASVACVAAAGFALWWAPQWPEMARRYDAPAGKRLARVGTAVPLDLATAEPIELWKSISEGYDPTSETDELDG